ncbi:heterokaryon incompatibility protein-domain-containing protein [Podospora aff. communis PSN243]|uniref:Heterokaryon incompatibility protein-domain-containing protein n=1 Tax=Podospora aff. communis PSN243 TaxID=3040156 RepID=A0AAV9G8P5_9PEZI|nr:heterokaryon incompatibility protein-domain-containing protein [Podospora aff. communis PSN243]
MPCDVCQDLARPAAGTSVVVGGDLADLVEFAANCEVCNLLLAVVQDAKLHSVDKFELTLNDKSYHSIKIHCKTLSERPLAVEIHFLSYEDFKAKRKALAELNANTRDAFEGVRCPYTDSDSSFAWVQSQIASCAEPEHPTCPPMKAARLPDRILSIGQTNADIHLHVSQGESKSYATLSHCWGGHLPIMLTKENLSSFQQNIPFDGLPKTFQDAIAFTRRLNIFYLWIDSLCIVQNDPSDWAEQSAQMASIYSLSSLNLAATSALDGRDGLFTPRRPSLTGYLTTVSSPHTHTPLSTLPLSNPPPLLTTFLIKEWTPSSHPSYTFTASLDSPELSTTLAGRGWVYQERLLSPRVLHFGHTDLYWECNTLATCQCGSWRHSGSRHIYAMFPKMMHTAAVKSVEEADGAELRYRWQRIVTEFSTMAVTFESDRLPAVAGIARQFWEKRKGLGYVMGMWREWMREHLLWHVVTWKVNTDKGERWGAYKESGVPSWTWASVGNAVQYEMEYPGDGIRPSFEKDTVRDPEIVRVPWAEGDKERLLGRTEGELVIRGHLTKTRMRRYCTTEGTKYGVTRYDGTDIYEVRVDSLPVDDSKWAKCEPGWMDRPGDDPERYVTYEWWEPETPISREDLLLLNWQSSPLKWWKETFESCEEFDESVWCLFIKFWDGSQAYHISLVLRRVVESPEKFARVGLLLYGPERLPIYEEGDTMMREVVLV